MAVPFFDLTRQSKALQKETQATLSAVIESAHFILGPNVAALEKEIAAYGGFSHAIGVASGTDALHLALRALDIGVGDEVITSAFTFIASAQAVSYTGAKPVFADIDPQTFNLNPSAVLSKVTTRTKAIIPIHLYGQTAEMNSLGEIARQHNLYVIEDAAQAFGATYHGKKAGILGDVGVISFFPTKNLGAFGDGGMILTQSAEIAEKVKMIRVHGGKVRDEYEVLGWNSRLDEIQAAVLRVKLKYLQRFIDARRAHAQHYQERLAGLPIDLPHQAPGCFHSYNQYTIRTKQRDELRTYLSERGIGSMIYYPRSLHRQPLYFPQASLNGDLRECERAEAEVLSLPIFPELRPEELEEVSTTVRAFYGAV